MGATEFRVIAYGRTPKDAFRSAVEQAVWEYGRDPYSGTIATKDSFVMFDVPKGMSVKEYVNKEINNMSKWGPAGCIVLEQRAVPIRRTKYTRSASRGSRQWRTVYTCLVDGHLVAEAPSLKEARKKAEALAKERGQPVDILVQKVLAQGSSHVATVSPVTAGPTTNKYLFFGLAPC